MPSVRVMNVLTHAASSRLFVVHLFVFGSGSVIRSTMLLSTEHVTGGGDGVGDGGGDGDAEGGGDGEVDGGGDGSGGGDGDGGGGDGGAKHVAQQ